MKRLLHSIIFLFIQCIYMGKVMGACNITKYAIWKNLDYIGSLRFDPDFWRYQTQRQFILSNSLAMELAYGKCVALFLSLKDWKAGRLGPIDDITTHNAAMCSKFCLNNDVIHLDAMEFTGCSCLELSTQPHEVSYTKPGDFCSQNTGRLQCDMLGFCGFWECRIDDFMCPRYEYNKRYIPYAGPGTCKSSASMYGPVMMFVGIAAIVVSLMLM